VWGFNSPLAHPGVFTHPLFSVYETIVGKMCGSDFWEVEP
jgi:hypothetical protein